MLVAAVISVAVLGADPLVPAAQAEAYELVAPCSLRAAAFEREDGHASVGWRGDAAVASAAALAAADVGALFLGIALVSATTPRCDGDVCVNGGALLLALAGVVFVPPTLALLAADATHGDHSTLRAVFASAAQAAAIGLLVASASTRADGARSALLASAAAVHFVGIPVVLGLAPGIGGSAGHAAAPAPTVRLALRW
jgi:hypothetical protein